MKMKNHGDGFGDDELVVADILLQLPEIIFISDHSRPLCRPWGVKRKRSDIDPYLSTSPTICPNVPSTSTPLSFSPTESDRKCKRIKDLFKKEEDWSKKVDDLTHQRELLKSEIKNVKRLRQRVKALNSGLKTKKQQCMAMAEAEAEAGVVVENGEQVIVVHNINPVVPQPQPLQLFPCHPDHRTIASTSGSDAANPTGPYVTPQENILGPDLDLSLNISLNADTAQLKRTAAAQARKKRLQICKCNLAEAGAVVESGEQVVVVHNINPVVPQPQPLQLFPCHPDHRTIASTSGSDVANPRGPYVTPHITVSQKENLGLDRLDLSLSIAVNADTAQVLKRTEAAAQVRKKRLQICEVKKPPSKKASCFIH